MIFIDHYLIHYCDQPKMTWSPKMDNGPSQNLSKVKEGKEYVGLLKHSYVDLQPPWAFPSPMRRQLWRSIHNGDAQCLSLSLSPCQRHLRLTGYFIATKILISNLKMVVALSLEQTRVYNTLETMASTGNHHHDWISRKRNIHKTSNLTSQLLSLSIQPHMGKL